LTRLIKKKRTKSTRKGKSIQKENQLTMNNCTPSQNKIQPNSTQSRRDLLESTKLSRLPERKPFPPKASAVCVGCDVRLDLFDPTQMRFLACRRCLGIYANIEAAFDEKTKREKREQLEKFAAEVKR
jgi:hypothetical protein